MAGQTTLLLAQDKFGPRFFVPAQFLPKKYSYYRPIPLTRIHVRTKKAKAKPLLDIDADLEDVDLNAQAASETGSPLSLFLFLFNFCCSAPLARRHPHAARSHCITPHQTTRIRA
jgi:hypothetical protein